MLQIRVVFNVPKIDKVRYLTALNKTLSKEMRNALRIFLTAAVRKVPVYTGMSRGALLDLGAELGVNIRINPAAGAQKRHPGQNPQAGKALASHYIRVDGLKRSFGLNIGVEHYAFLDIHAASEAEPYKYMKLIEKTPWNSMELGRAAFKKYVKENVKSKLPKVKKFISWTRVTSG